MSTKDGSDQAGDGSLAKPFATLSRAVDTAAKAQGKKAMILMRGGTYYLSAPIELTSAHSGLSIQNYDGEYVEVSPHMLEDGNVVDRLSIRGKDGRRRCSH